LLLLLFLPPPLLLAAAEVEHRTTDAKVTFALIFCYPKEENGDRNCIV